MDTLASLGFEVDSSPLRRAQGDMRGLSDQSRRTEGQVSRSSRAMGNSLISVRSIARTIAPVLAGIGASFSVSSIVRQTASFQDEMLRLQAVSGATQEAMAALESQARSLGATTIFSAQQAGQAQVFLAQAGFSANEVISATPDVLRLATAAGMDLARAADIASNALSGFRLSVSELPRVNDVLANTAAKANTNVEQLGQALSFAAPIATAAGISIEETAGAIGALSDAGLQASRAGTGFVGFVRQLSNITPAAADSLARYGVAIEDVDITARGLGPVIDTLAAANISTADSFKIFGSEAGAAAQIIMGTAERVQELTDSNREAEGTSEDMANILGSGLSASLKAFSSAISESALQIGNSSGSMQFLIDSATGVVSALNGMTSEFQESTGVSDRAARTYEATASALTAATYAAIGYAAPMIAVRTALIGANIAQAAFNATVRANPYLLIASSVAAATVAIISFRDAQEDAVDVWERAAESEEEFRAAQDNVRAANRIQEIVQERMRLEERRQKLEERGFRRYSRAATEHENIGKKLAALEAEYHKITDARIRAEIANTERLEQRKREEAEAEASRQRLLREQEEARQRAAEAAEAARTAGARAIIQGLEDEVVALTTSSEKLLENRLLREGATEAQIRQALSLQQAISILNNENDQNLSQAQQIVDSLQDQYRQMVLTERQYTAVRLAAAGASSAQVQAAMDALDAIEALNKEADETLDWADRLSAISDGFGSIRDTMDSGSDAAQRLGIAMQALAVAQGVVAVVNQGTGDPYTAFGRMAAMAAAVASLGIQINSLGGGPSVSERRQQTQGTGTVFGDAEAKSESILKATEITADATQQLVGINRGMLSALQMMQRGIDSVSAGLVRQGFGRGSDTLSGMEFGRSAVLGSGVEFLNPASVEMAMIDIFGASPLTEALRGFHGSLFQSINREILRDSRRLQDQGIELIGGSFAAIIDGSIAFAQEYAEVSEKRKFLGVTIRERVGFYTQELSQEVNEGILSVFVGMADSVSAAAEILGVSSSEIERRFREFNVAAQLISLTDLDANERQDEIAAVFSNIFDNLAGAVVPYVEEFAQIGEGYAETLTRIATEVQVAEYAVEMLGLRFSELSGRQLVEASSRLIDLGGGLDEFISNMQSFTGRFASEAEQFRLNAQNLERGLDGLPLPQTRDGFWQLMQAQDAATEAGARNIATLLRLQGIADQYYNHLESQQRDLERVTDASLSELRRIVDRDMDRVREAYQSAQQAIQDEAQERLAANRAAISAAQSLASAIEAEFTAVGRALSGLIGGTISQEARRQSAVQRLVRAVSVGDFTGAGDAAQIAAGINADSFESASDFRVEQARTIALLTRVQRGADQQLSEAQLQLQSIEAQTSVIEASRDAQLGAAQMQHDREIERLDKIYEQAEDSLNALRGISDGVQTLNEALGDFYSAIQGERGDWYAGMGGRANHRNIPGFANGGAHAGGLRIVGERGPEIEATGPSRVMNNKDLMSALGNNERLINEVRQMRQDIQRGNFAIAKNTQKTARQLERWDVDGLPEERVL